MISLKRHIESAQSYETLLQAMVGAYRSTLSAIGEAAAQACPSLDTGIGGQLAGLGEEIGAAADRETIDEKSNRIADTVRDWAGRAEADVRGRTADVKQLLVTLAHTAASVAATDAAHAIRFDALTERLEKVATLADVSELREAVVASARELRASVDAVSQSRRASLKAMQTELQTYQVKLDAAEKIAAHDPLTGLFNRRKVETAIQQRIERRTPFTIGLIDLDGFKTINDQFGHQAGDDLLRQFSADLKANCRADETAGRWGGDEFIVVFDGIGQEASTHFRRLQQWVGGSYTIGGLRGTVKVQLTLSIGAAEWAPGTGLTQLIEQADRQMYTAKRSRHR